MSTPKEVGAFLAGLRASAGLKQAGLAKQLEWSGALLSRIESGERPVSDEELGVVLNGIGTPAALKALNDLKRVWQRLPAPNLSDPDGDLLWEAEGVAQAVYEMSERPDVKQFFERRLVRYQQELAETAARVRDKRYKIALVGTIAVGKSTAICRAERLELPSAKGMPKAVLETGAGGITICEVHLREGPEFGIIVEPCSEDELRRQVTEFAGFLINPSQLGNDDENDGPGGSPGISREVERAIRNMAGFKRRRLERKPDGTTVPAWDEARELATQYPDIKALSVEILARMQLHRRDRRDAWHEDASRGALEWLQETFEEVNNGRHPEFGLPRRIELIVPMPILGDSSLAVTLVDTQGVDDVVERADLEQHFDDPHTIMVLCTVFNEAPATAVRQLLIRAKEGGVRTLRTHAAILVLPRPGDALAMKDNGAQVHSADEGYDLKAEEIELKLHPLGVGPLPVQFFNSAEEEPGILREFLKARIRAVQEEHRRELREIIAGAQALVINYEKEQSQEVMRAAARHLTTWLTHNSELDAPSSKRVCDSLIAAISTAHVKTIYAAVIREGDWTNLDYSHQLSHGARRIATKMAQPKLKAFQDVATNLLHDDQYADAHDLVRQTIRALEGGFDTLVRKTQLVGQSIYADEMRPDADFWRACYREWGRGRGYRDRLARLNRAWFDEESHAGVDERVTDLVKAEWTACLLAVKELLRQG